MSLGPEPGGTRREVQRVLPAAPSGPTLAWWGTVLGLISYFMVLSAVLFAYAFLGALAGGWPPAGTEPPGLLRPAVATGLLLGSVVPAVAVQRAGRAARPGLLQSAALTTAVLGAGHIGVQALTYADLPMAPTEGAYGSVFLLLLVLHHLGLLGGIVGLVMVALQVWDRPGERTRGSAMALGLWWYGMVAMWVLVFATLYLSPLVLGGAR